VINLVDNQFCQKCYQLVSKVKNNGQVKFYHAYRVNAGEKIHDVFAPAICENCYSRNPIPSFANANRIDSTGKLVGPKSLVVLLLKRKISELESTIESVKSELSRVESDETIQ
jgi:ribosomal protein L40E